MNLPRLFCVSALALMGCLSETIETHALDCGAGFVQVNTHGDFYSATYAGRLAYAPLAGSVDAAKRAQLFCVFTDAKEYVLPRRPAKIFFVVNNLKVDEEPLGNSYILAKFVRFDATPHSPAAEFWKLTTEVWQPEALRRRRYFHTGDIEVRDKFVRQSAALANEVDLEDSINVDIHGTTRPTAVTSAYSTWEHSRAVTGPLGKNDGLKVSVLAFAVRPAPPSFRSEEDRRHRVVFEISPGTATSLQLQTFGPPGQNSTLTRSYRLYFGSRPGGTTATILNLFSWLPR